MSTLWRFVLRQPRRRPFRAALTMLGIVIGVASIVAVSLTTQATRRVYQQMFQLVAGKAQLEINREGQTGFSPDVEAIAAAVAGVKAAVGSVQHSVIVSPKMTDQRPFFALGIDPQRDTQIRQYEFQQGRMLENPTEVVLAAFQAEKLGLQLGDSVSLVAKGGISHKRVVGLLKAVGPARVNMGAVVFLRLDAAQEMFGFAGQINSVSVVVDADKNVAAIQQTIQSKLDAGLIVRQPAMRGQLVRHTMMNLEQLLSVLSIVSLVSGAFVIFNTFRMNLGERRRQLAILRAIGATRWQVTSLLLKEGAVYGILGTGFGIGFGYLLAASLTSSTATMLGIAIATPGLSLEPLLLAIILGPGMAIAATYLPARRAGQRSILADLLNRRSMSKDGSAVWPRAVGAVCIATTLAIVGGFMAGYISPEQGRVLLTVAMFLLLMGIVLVLPLAVSPLFRIVGNLVARLLGVEGKLAVRHLRHHHQRTGITIAIVVIAMMVTIGPGNETLTMMDHMQEWSEKVAGDDYYLFAGTNDAGFTLTPPSIDVEVATEIERIPGVQDVSKLSWFPATIHHESALLVAYDYRTEYRDRLNATVDSPQDVVERMRAGECVVGTTFAIRHQLKIGDTIELATRTGPKKIRIAGKSDQYHAGGMLIMMDWQVAQPLFDLQGATYFCVNEKRGATGVRQALTELATKRGLQIQSFEDLRQETEVRIARGIDFVWVLMGMVFIVAGMGIINTLGMNVLEQTRELSVLRAIGMGRWQLGKVVFCQGITIGLVAVIPGVAIGILVAYMMNVPSEALTGHIVGFRVHWSLLLVAVLGSMSATCLAALVPARYAAQQQILQGLQHE